VQCALGAGQTMAGLVLAAGFDLQLLTARPRALACGPVAWGGWRRWRGEATVDDTAGPDQHFEGCASESRWGCGG
jgi:hypothetical protein